MSIAIEGASSHIKLQTSDAPEIVAFLNQLTVQILTIIIMVTSFQFF